MGASSWAHRTPYQDDINAALQAARWQAYRSGDYYHSSDSDRDLTEAEFRTKYGDADGWVSSYELAAWFDSKTDVVDPDTLARSQPHSGTHSIIDMTEGVSAVPAYGTVSPLDQLELVTLFGTATPSSEQVLGAHVDIERSRGRWVGTYVVSFADGRPNEIHFIGYSGD